MRDDALTLFLRIPVVPQSDWPVHPKRHAKRRSKPKDEVDERYEAWEAQRKASMVKSSFSFDDFR